MASADPARRAPRRTGLPPEDHSGAVASAPMGTSRWANAWKVLRSGPFKIAVAFALAISVTTYGVFAFVTWEVADADIVQAQKVLEDEAAKAADLPALEIRNELQLRLTHDLRRVDYVGLFDANGVRSYGNVSPTDAVPVDGIAHLIDVPFGRSDVSREAVFVARRRTDGGVLVLGRGLYEVYHLKATVRLAFLAAILPSILVAIATGVLASIGASRRLAEIQHAILRVMQGQLSVRLPRRKRLDDINELVDAVNVMLDEIVRLLNQIKSVGDNIAHDLKTPLAVMRARLERGLYSCSHDELVAVANDAMRDLDKAMTTVTALLRISELEGGLQRRAFTDVDLSAICRDVFDLFEPLASAKAIGITLAMPPARPFYGDGDLLREAIANLVDNAIKFTPNGGVITLQGDVDGALLRVCDSGPGVALDERDKIFKRFYRAHEARGVPGAGLGLSMAATIVALHGYVLKVSDNRPGAVFALVSSNHPQPD